MKITKEQLLEELKAGLTRRQIAQKYGMSYQAVNNRVAQLKAAGIEIPQRKINFRKNRRHRQDGRCVPRCGKSDCKYSVSISGGMMCDYLSMTGHSRGCEAKNCTVYEPIRM